MNRTHRVVWSDSRQAFVVVSEKAKTKGKPSSARKAIALAVVMALSAMVTSPAIAATSCPGGGSTISITGSENSTCYLATSDALTVTNTGLISGTNPAVAVDGTAATSIDNSGTISGTAIGIDIYSSGSVTGAITNSGAISGGGFGIHIVSGSSVGSITNNVGGTIAGSGGISLFTGSSVTGGISNSGAITGGSYGIGLNNSSLTGGIVNNGTITGSRGIYLVNGSSADSITNNVGGSISGNSAGIALDSSSSISGNIVNDGTISGGQTGLHISNSSSVAGDITNSGTIEGTRGTSSGTGYGINLSGGSTVGSITNSGTIQGIGGTSYGNGYGIYVNGGTIGSVVNNGTIQGTGGTSSGSGYGIYVNGGTIGSINNSGTISGTGQNGGYGIYLVSGGTVTGSITNDVGGIISGNSAGIALYSSSIGDSITNSGTITGHYGIDLQNSSSITNAITNNLGGTISGTGSGVAIRIGTNSTVGSIVNDGTISGGRTGLYISGNSTVTGGITNSGTITGGTNAIYITSSSTVGGITNTGTINGAVVLGGTTLNLNGTAGSISGAVTGGVGSVVNVNGTFTTANTFAVDTFNIVSGATLNAGYGITANSAFNNSGTTTLTAVLDGASSKTNTTTGVLNLGVNGSVGALTNDGVLNLDGGTVTDAVVGTGTVNVNSDYTTAASFTANTFNVANGVTFDAGHDITANTAFTNNGITTLTAVLAGAGSKTNAVGAVLNLGVSGSVGTLTNDGVLNMNGGTVNGDITNTGAINGALALGGGTLNLNGTAGSITGAVSGSASSVVNVNGTFTTANTFAVDSFNIASTGRLNMGNDITPATAFDNAGTLNVAAGTTSTINGNYTQTTTGTFQTGVSDNTTYGKLVVTGTATLPTNAKIDVNVANPAFAFTATSMAGIISAGTLTSDGTFAVTDNSTLFDFTASKNGNTVDLALAVAGGGGGGGNIGVMNAVTSTGNTPGIGAATVLDGLVADFAGGGTGNADMDTVIGTLGAMTTNQQVSDAVTQMLPLMTGGMTQVTFANLRSLNRMVQAHQEGNRGLSSGDNFVGNRQAWIKPLGSWAGQKNRNGAFGYDAQTYGVALGADSELSQISRIGAAFAYTHIAVDSNSGAQTAGVDSYLAELYGSRSLDENTELNWQVDYGYNQNRGDRYITFVNRTARSNYHSDSFHLGTGIGRTIPMSAKTSFTPSFRADYTTIKENGYTETGADALNLVVNGKTTDELILAVDGKLAHAVSDTSTLTANLGFGYDTQAKQASITASFTGGGASFTTNGISPSSTVVRGGLGMVINSSDAMEVTARYDIETRSGYTGQTFSVKLKKPF